MTLTAWVTTGYDAKDNEIEREVWFTATREPPDQEVGEPYGQWFIEDVQWNDTGESVPCEIVEEHEEDWAWIAEEWEGEA